MSHTIAEIAAALSAEAEGDLTLTIDGVAEPAGAGPAEIALALSPAYAEGLPQGRARAAILWPGADWRATGLSAAIFVGRARYGMADLTRLMDRGAEIAPGIHPTAVIDPTAEVGEGAAIAPFVVIGARVRIGPGARLGAHVSIGRDTVIGANARIDDGARIAHEITIGDNFICHFGVSVGADGLSFVPPEGLDIATTRRSFGEGHAGWAGGPAVWRRVHSLGGVEIGDDVEIGGNANIDRGTIRATKIGRGTKIDGLVHIGHNVVIGEDCLLCSGTGIAGSTRVGDRCVLAGQTGVSDNITIGADVITGGGTKIYSNVPAGRVIMGSPAVRMDAHIETYKAIRRLPRLIKQVAELQKLVRPGKAGPGEDEG